MMQDIRKQLDSLSPEKRELLIKLMKEQGIPIPEQGIIPLPRDGRDFPLSFAQRRLWFLEEFEPGSPVYNIPCAVRISGNLDEALLEQAVNDVLARHEILRTTFHSVDGRPVQRIAPSLTIPFAVHDFRAHKEPEKEALTLATELSRISFDLSRGPLLRGTIVRIGDEDRLFLLVMHHIVSDGWSTGVLLGEVKALYECHRTGNNTVLPPLPVQYADFAVWQQEWLKDDRLTDQLSYWKKQLQGSNHVLDLPLDYGRPAVQTSNGTFLTFRWPVETLRGLGVLGHAEGATLFMTLMAAFQAVLGRYTGQDDINVGTPIAGRTRSETEALIGFFINTLVIRGDLAGNPTFREFLRRVRNVTTDAYTNQDLPFETLVENILSSRTLSRTPLFQAMFVLNNAPLTALESEELRFSPVEIDSGTAKFDLVLSLIEHEGALRGKLEYNTDLFRRASIERFLQHLTAFVNEVAKNPDMQILDVSLEESPGYGSLYASGESLPRHRFTSVQEAIEEQVECSPDAVAVVCGDEQLTYRELNRRANALAVRLCELGAGPESTVGVYAERSVESIVAFLGILKAGAAYIPIDHTSPVERLRFIAGDARLHVLLTRGVPPVDPSLLPSSVRQVELPVDVEESTPNGKFAVPVDRENLAYIIYTSGSTGQPKGVLVPQGPLAEHCQTIIRHYALTSTDRVLQFASLSFDASIEQILPTLMTGAALVMRGRDLWSIPEFTALGKGLTIANPPTSYWHQLVEEWKASPELLPDSSLRLFIAGGDRMSAAAVQRWKEHGPKNVQLLNAYGPTETVITAATYDVVWQPADDKLPAEVPIGFPLPGRAAYILDRQGRPVATGIRGELYLGGDRIARGYLNRPDLTALQFLPDPFSGIPGSRMYRSGDLARRLPDGSIEFLGRSDNQVKVRGFRIELGEVEAALRSHTLVQQAVVCVREDGAADRRLVAYVVPADGPEVSAGMLRDFLRTCLPAYMVPSAYVLLERMPLTTGGKVDRRALPAPEGSRDNPETPYVAPRTATEIALAEIWEHVLGTRAIGVFDNFFERGGHSLLATQVVSRIRSVLRAGLPLRTMFERPTIGELAAEIDRRTRQQDSAQLPIVHCSSRGTVVPLSFAQQRMWFLNQWDSDNPAYNIVAPVHIKGRLDIELLERVVNTVVEHHESLRTSFVTVNGRPFQTIVPDARLRLVRTDLSFLPEPQRHAEAYRLATEDARKPFNLGQAPLIRGQIITLGPDEYFAMFVMHHIIADGWSAVVFIKALGEQYLAGQDGKAPGMASPALQYSDFAAWQKEYLQGKVLDDLLGYWKPRLANVTPFLDRMTDRPKSAVSSYQGAHLSFDLGQDLSDKLRLLAREEGVTLFMTLLAAFQTLLHRYSGSDDIPVGVPIAGRNRTETEGVIGLFVNTIVARAHFGAPTRSFREILSQVRDDVLGAFDHQDMPFSMLVDELQPGRRIGRTPLFEVMFDLQRPALQALKTDGLALEAVELETGTAKLDLMLMMSERPDGIRGTLEYSTDLFDASTIKTMAQSLQVMLQAIALDPSLPVSALPIMSTEDRRHLLEDLNATRTAFSSEKTFPELFEEQVLRTPDAPAAVFEGTSLTYSELNRQANVLALHLNRNGVGRETLVGLYVERSVDMIVGLFGIWKAGGAYVPMDPSLPVSRLQVMLEDTGVALVLTQRHLVSFLPPGCKGILLEEVLAAGVRERDEKEEAGEGLRPGKAGPGNLAYLIYTSGSTGKPKGVMIEHRAVINLWVALRSIVYAKAGDRSFRLSLNAPLYFDASVQQLVMLLGGHSLYIIPQDIRGDGEALVAFVRRHRLHGLDCVPSQLKVMLEAGLLDEAEWVPEFLLPGGEAIDERTWKAMAGSRVTAFFNMYGPTECTVDSTICPVRSMPGCPSIGRPVSNVSHFVLDASLSPVPIGITGELYIGGAGVGRGYLHHPDATAERFIPDPFSAVPGSRLYRTGDLVRYLPDGNLEFIGRVDSQIKIRGFRVELGDIEAALRLHPLLKDAVVLLREDKPNQQRLVGYVIPSTASVPSPGELRSFLKERLPDYMVPVAFIPLDAFPMTPNGKLDRKVLPPPDGAGAGSEKVYVAPRTALEQHIAGLWKELLNIDNVGVYDDFFELGGDSLKAAILVNRLQQELGERAHVSAIFVAPSIAELSMYINAYFPEAVNKRFGVDEVGTNLYKDRVGALEKTEPLHAETVAAFRSLIPPLGPPPEADVRSSNNPPAVFVLSPPRSGSTLLRVMMAGNTALFSPPELELLSFTTLEERKAALSSKYSLWLEATVRAIMEIRSCNADEAERIMRECEERKLTVKQFYALLQEWIGGRLLVDKTPMYALDMEILRRAESTFTNARFIHLTRQPYATVYSFVEARLDDTFFRYRHSFSPRQLAELIWLVSHQNILKFLREIPEERQHRIRFEDLVRDPRGSMEALCAFLGVPFTHAMLRPYEQGRMTDGISSRRQMVGDFKFYLHKGIEKKVADRWKTFHSMEFLSEESWAVAETLGYSRDKRQTSGEEPAPSRREQAALTIPHAVSLTGEGLPLSFPQEQLWFVEQLEPGTAVYNIPAAFRLSGALSIPALEQSLHAIIGRHDVLRSSIVVQDGKPVQVIHPLSPPLRLVPEDVIMAPDSTAAESLDRIVAEEAAIPFDLAKGPLLRVRLIRAGEEEHVLLLTVHHIIADGWSIGVFLRELASLYRAFVSGQTNAVLPDLPIQYADFARWQRKRLEEGELQEKLDYWAERLQGVPALELPTDRPRQAVSTVRGARQSFVLDTDVLKSVHDLATDERVTPFMVFLSTFLVLLHRYSGQHDISVGTPVANRTHSETEPLIGLFANTLVLRAEVSGKQTFHALLQQVRQIWQEAFDHQEVPLEKIVDALRLERSLSHHPLFQVMFSHRRSEEEEVNIPGLAITPMVTASETAKFDLMLEVTERAGLLRVTFEYRTMLFEDGTITRMAQHLENILRAVIDNPGRAISDLPMLSSGERRRILQEWNQDHATLPAAPLHRLFEAQAARTPGLPAVQADGKALTYAELNRKANNLARRLRHLGVRTETLVGLYAERCPEMIAGILAVMKAGGAYVPMDPLSPTVRQQMILEDTGISIVLTQRHLASSLPFGCVCIFLEDEAAGFIDGDGEENLPEYASPENLAYLIYTSGSTGKPKGVMIQHRTVVNLWTGLLSTVYYTAGDRHLNVSVNAPLFFDASVQQIVMLLSGHCLHILPQEIRGDGDALVKFIRRNRIDAFDCVPSQMKVMLDAGLLDETEWVPEFVLPGGEAIDERTWRTIAVSRSANVFNMYGPTECSVDATICSVRTSPACPNIGRPICNTQVYVLDQALQPVPVGVTGELFIGGAGVGRGYFRRPALTAERFLPDPFAAAPGARLYRTGDLVRFLPDGNLEYIGRGDSQVKIRGFRVELGDIEAALDAHPALEKAVVLVREDTPGDKRLAAYMVAHHGQTVTSTQLRSFLKERLPGYMIPAYFIVLDVLPMTPNGKLDRKALPPPTEALEHGSNEFAPPQSSREKTLAAIWSEILHVKQIGLDDNFFELGGDSILSIQAVSRANQQGLRLTPRLLFQNPTLRALAVVAEEGAGSALRAEQGPVTGHVPLTPVQRWLFEQDLAEPNHWNQSILIAVKRPLKRALLEQTLKTMLVHHDAIRASFRKTAGGWEQEILDVPERTPFTWIDLSTLPGEERESRLKDEAERLQASFDLGEGCLLRAAYFDAGTDSPGRLLIIIHHLVIDGVSWRILLEDLLTTYKQLEEGRTALLPAKTVSYLDWATRLPQVALSEETAREKAYWLSVADRSFLSVPVDFPGGVNTERSVDAVGTRLTEEQTQILIKEVPAVYGASPDVILLTALLRAYSRWAGQRSLAVDVEGHGRGDVLEEADISRTVGWFTVLYPVVLEQKSGGTLLDALRKVNEAMARIPRHGVGYGLLRYLSADADVARRLRAMPEAEVSFNYLGQYDGTGGVPDLFEALPATAGLERGEQNKRRYVLDLVASVYKGYFHLRWTYSTNLHRRSTVEMLAQYFMEELHALIALRRSIKQPGFSPPSIADAALSNDEIANLITEISENSQTENDEKAH